MIRTAAIVILVLIAGCRPYEPHGTLIDPPMEVPSFTLMGDGGEVHREDFEGRLVVMFFGFTTCPDVCPDTMARIARAVEELDEREAAEVEVVLVSVDPERDPPDRIAQYARTFDTGFVGLTGTSEQIDRVAAGYGIYHARVEYEDRDGYTVDHTAHILVLDRTGRTVLIWSPGTESEAMAADLRFLIRRI